MAHITTRRSLIPGLYLKTLSLLGCLLALLVIPVQAELLLQPNDRIALCGNGAYVNLFESCLLMSKPVDGLDVMTFDWSPGASSPAAFLGRLNTDLLPFKPTVVLLSFNTGDLATRAKDQTALVEALKKAGVRTIVVGSPKCVDSTLYHNDPAKAADYNKQLSALADIDKSVAAAEGVTYADVFGATMDTMTRAKAALGNTYDYCGGDELSTSEGAALTMACAFLKALGCDQPIGQFTLDFATKTAEVSPGHQLISYDGYTLKVESTRQPFHSPGYPSGRPDPDPYLKFIPFNNVTNRFLLTIKNIPTPAAKIAWADETHDFTAAELAHGINLTGTMLNRQFGGQSENVGGVYNLVNLDRTLGAAQAAGKPDPQADAKHASALADAKKRTSPLTQTISLALLAAPDKLLAKPNIIIDTDMSSDVDDAGAVALINSFAVQGQAKLIACAIDVNNSDLSSGAVVQAINAWYGHPDVPIGVYHGEAGPNTKMTSILAPAPTLAYHGPARTDGSLYTLATHKRFNPDFPYDDKLPAGIDVYRKALAAAPDDSVIIVSIGVMPNIQDLIQSQPDSVSNLDGLALVKKKVHELVVMGNTTYGDTYIYSKWPTKIVWTLGLGTTVYTGRSLQAAPEDNPVRFAYEHYGTPAQNAMKDGRGSWDLTAAWFAVRGSGDLWDEVPGHWRPDPPPGYGTWIEDIHSRDHQIIAKMNGDQVNQIIDTELARPPKPGAVFKTE
jgi:hypothetical protein